MTASKIKIGLEYEGVFLKHGVPIRSVNLVRDKSFIWKDTYDACAEVRTDPLQLEGDGTRTIIRLGSQLLTRLDSLNLFLKTEGGDAVWDEIIIPDSVHEDIMDNVQFKKKPVKCALSDSEIDAKISNAYESDRYRGGGLHINISGIPDSRIPIVAKLLAKGIPPPTADQPHRSQYRKPGLWKRSPYPGGENGFEYRSAGFGFNPNGIKHFWHIMEATMHILCRERGKISQ